MALWNEIELRHSGAPTKEEAQDKDDSRDDEEDLGEVSRKSCDAPKAQKRSNNSDNGKDNGPSKHKITPSTKALRQQVRLALGSKTHGRP